ncbi:MAG: hypothetical protein QOG58_2196, partial [Caballeronia sp.]|nr:hypothetical protein [Caballeronia sp.]
MAGFPIADEEAALSESLVSERSASVREQLFARYLPYARALAGSCTKSAPETKSSTSNFVSWLASD